MEKLTLSIGSKEKIAWVKVFAKANETSVSQLFESYVDALMEFDKKEVKLTNTLKTLRKPGKRPSQKAIERHLNRRRQRSASKS